MKNKKNKNPEQRYFVELRIVTKPLSDSTKGYDTLKEAEAAKKQIEDDIKALAEIAISELLNVKADKVSRRVFTAGGVVSTRESVLPKENDEKAADRAKLIRGIFDSEIGDQASPEGGENLENE